MVIAYNHMTLEVKNPPPPPGAFKVGTHDSADWPSPSCLQMKWKGTHQKGRMLQRQVQVPTCHNKKIGTKSMKKRDFWFKKIGTLSKI